MKSLVAFVLLTLGTTNALAQTRYDAIDMTKSPARDGKVYKIDDGTAKIDDKLIKSIAFGFEPIPSIATATVIVQNYDTSRVHPSIQIHIFNRYGMDLVQFESDPKCESIQRSMSFMHGDFLEPGEVGSIKLRRFFVSMKVILKYTKQSIPKDVDKPTYVMVVNHSKSDAQRKLEMLKSRKPPLATPRIR